MTSPARRRCKWCGRSTLHWILDEGGHIACADQCRGEDRYRSWHGRMHEVLDAIDRHGGNLSAAGRELKLEREAVYRMLMKHVPWKLKELACGRSPNGAKRSAEVEERMRAEVLALMDKHNWHLKTAANDVGVTPGTVQYRLYRYARDEYLAARADGRIRRGQPARRVVRRAA